jgi:hypothetical protein
MAELKTKKTDASVDDFIDALPEESRRADCRALVTLMQQVTKSPPVMWGPSIVGFGSIRYKYETGREGDWFLSGFSPRKQALTIYIMAGFDEQPDLMSKLGKFKTGKCCLYVKKLADIDQRILKKLVTTSVKQVKALYR